MSCPPSWSNPVRVDLHCHCSASAKAGEAVFAAIDCPESFTEPLELYRQAKRRGMDFVAITDHDTIDGALTLCDRDDLIVGEELTCWFPEDRCKIHLLVWGLSPSDHHTLQSLASDIHQVAQFIEQRRLAHAVAHPLYRQNDRLERWHLERLLLLFKGFECINGAHSALHRTAFEPMLDELTEKRLRALSEKHLLLPLWPEPHVKSRTGGSDDHGLLNVGRTWTEFPPGTDTVERALECLRIGRCRAGGETGSSLKLAHNFLSVGIRYVNRRLVPADAKPSLVGGLMRMLVGERPAFRKRDLVKAAVKNKLWKLREKIAKPFRRKKGGGSGTALLIDLFLESFRSRIGEHPRLVEALRNGQAPLAEHDEVFRFICGLHRDTTRGIAQAVSRGLEAGRITALFDAVSAVLAQQFMLLPYYFSVFHQNRERRLLGRLTDRIPSPSRGTMRLAVFTDTLDEVNGVARFIRDMAHTAHGRGLSLTVHTCCNAPRFEAPWRKNFRPMLAGALPGYRELEFNLPPVAEILAWADQQQFDAVHVHTPGPMGLVGHLVANMLQTPLLGTYHTDFPAYVSHFTGGDFRVTLAAQTYMKWFYSRLGRVLARSRRYVGSLDSLGVPAARQTVLHAGIDVSKFNAGRRDEGVWARLGVAAPRRLLYCGRVSVEKNLPMLVDIFRRLCERRKDAALVLAGDGPYRSEMQKRLAGLPAHFLGYQDDEQLAVLYASADLFVFPSRTDTLGQVVCEAQASGLPVLVGSDGGPREVTDDGVTGLVLPPADVEAWVGAIERLLDDEPLRSRMGRTAGQRSARFGQEKTFEQYWDAHYEAILTDPALAHPTQAPAEARPFADRPMEATV